MDQKKLLCLAFDPVRGGAPLPDLEAECPAHLQHAVFGLPTAKRSIIAWHRVKDVCTRSHYSTYIHPHRHRPSDHSDHPNQQDHRPQSLTIPRTPNLALPPPQFQLESLKLLTEQMLLGSTLRGISGALFIPGELQRQRLTLSRRVVVYVSPHNPGASAVAKDLASAMNGQLKVTSDATEGTITHFLLYLNDKTYKYAAGESLAEELHRARAAGIEVVMVHENDQERGGCDFAIFFDGRTPQFLNGIYDVRACCLPRLTQSNASQPRPRLAGRRSRWLSTPGGSGRSLPRWLPRRWARPLPVCARAAAALRQLRRSAQVA